MKRSLGKILFVWMITVGQVWGAYQWSVLEAPKVIGRRSKRGYSL